MIPLLLKEEVARCLLCANAACTMACPKMQDPAKALRSVRFENPKNAGIYLDKAACAGCDGACEKACIHYDKPIRIRETAELLPTANASEKPSLAIEFCGVKCENPFFLSSSCVAAEYEMVSRALSMGWGGVVFKTIAKEPCRAVSPRFSAVQKDNTPFIGFKNLEQLSEHTVDENFEALSRLKAEFPTKVIIASIMGNTDEEWAELAQMACRAGVDIIECNFSCPHTFAKGQGSDVGQDPSLVKHFTEIVVKNSTVPVMPKMTPNIQDITVPALAAKDGGCQAISAINTIKCLTGIDEDTFVSYPSISGKSSVSGYSGKAVKPIALKFLYDMTSHKDLKDIEFSGIGGIETWKDALEFILLGCRNVQVTTAVMQYGYRIIEDFISGLQTYMQEKGYTSLEQLVGKALEYVVSSGDLDTDTYVLPRFDWKKCVQCGRCMLSCQDAGHQALEMADGKVRFLAKKCVGCHLCAMVCPVEAIKTDGKRLFSKNLETGVNMC